MSSKKSFFMSQGTQCVKEMLYFETNFWNANVNWKGLTSLSIHSWFRWQSFNGSFTFLESLPESRFLKYSIISFYLNPNSDRMWNHFPKGQDSRKVGAGRREFTYQWKAVFGDGKRIRNRKLGYGEKSLDFYRKKYLGSNPNSSTTMVI